MYSFYFDWKNVELPNDYTTSLIKDNDMLRSFVWMGLDLVHVLSLSRVYVIRWGSFIEVY